MGVLTAQRSDGVGTRRAAPVGGGGGPIKATPALRIVAPGRLERAYQARIGELKEALETSSLVERGAQRCCDRMEGRLEQTEQHLEQSRQVERRLCATLGSLERENSLLRERIGRLGEGRRRTRQRWLAVLLGRDGRGS